MNNRDPFNLRNSSASAFSLIQARATAAVDTAKDTGRKAIESARVALEDAGIDLTPVVGASPERKKGRVHFEDSSPERKRRDFAPDTATSSSGIQLAPRWPPAPSVEEEPEADDMSFSVPRNVPSFQDPVRQYEDAVWRSRAPAASQPGVAAQLGIDGIFGGHKNGLPMYKDKPYLYGISGRRTPLLKRKRVLALLITILLVVGWWLGVFSSGVDDGKRKVGGGKVWTGLRGKKGVDWDARRDSVKEAFKDSWSAYEKSAWGYDEFHPISQAGRQMVPPNGMGWIIVDALDTLILMNMTTELAHARQWISSTLHYDLDHDVNTFETTIRMLGGLLSAHYLSTTFPSMAPIPVAHGSNAEDLYLEKAVDLADRLLSAYDSPSGIPYASVNMKTRHGIQSHMDGGASSTAEATTLQLEMKYLAKLTGEVMYWEKAEKVMQVVDDNMEKDGILPIFIKADTGHFQGNNIRLGSRGDSYYEYLIKQYLQTSSQEPLYRNMWEDALAGIKKHLLTYSTPSNFLVLAELPSGLDGALEPKMDHLVCFMPGTIALAVTGGASVAHAKKKGWTAEQEEEMNIAVELMKTCWGMYKVNPTGLAAEISHFHLYDKPKMYRDGVLKSDTHAFLEGEGKEEWKKDFNIKNADRHNLLRPETVESLFYMWRITGDEMYREWGWEMFESFRKWTKVPSGGYSSIDDVTETEHENWRDNMESFWLAETLKYFYLLFSDADILPLDTIVLNTEAHPLPRFELGRLFSTGWQRQPRPDSHSSSHPDQHQKHVEVEKEAHGRGSHEDEHAEQDRKVKEVALQEIERLKARERKQEARKEGAKRTVVQVVEEVPVATVKLIQRTIPITPVEETGHVSI